MRKVRHGSWFSRAMWAVGLLATASGCTALRTPYIRPIGAVPAQFAHSDPTAQAAPERWWEAYGDAQLNALVADVLARNTDLAAAGLRIRAADLQRRLAVINPTISASYSDETTKPLKSGISGSRSSSLDVNVAYEIDLWGALAATKDAASWEARATREDLASTRLELIDNTVNLYFQIAEINQELALSNEDVSDAQRSLQIVEGLAAAGGATPLDVAQVRETLAQQQAARTQLQEDRVEARNALTVLRDGTPWSTALEPTALPPDPPPPVAAGLPAALLGRRPDLRAAEMRLRESLAQADATRLNFYPQLSLTGSLGTVSTGLSQLLTTPIATLTANLAAPFVQWNQARFTSELARVQYREAVVAFRKTLVQALVDVDNALSQRAELAKEGGRLDESASAAAEVERLSAILFRAGATPLQPWLDAQAARRAAETAKATNQLARLQNYANLCLALGGVPQSQNHASRTGSGHSAVAMTESIAAPVTPSARSEHPEG